MKGMLNLWMVVILVVCALSLWFGKDFILPESAKKLNVPVPTAKQEAPESDAGPVHLLVLNGTAESGLARDFGLLLGRTGCVAEKVGNAPHNDYAKSFLVNRGLPQQRIDQLAADLGNLPVLLEFDGRSTADAVLVLGRDHGAIREKLRAKGP